MTERVELQKKAKGQRPQYFKDPAIDKVLSITMALAGEVAVLRDRLDTIERLSEESKPITRESVDSFIPDAKVREERDDWREVYLGNILRIIHHEREELAREGQKSTPYDDAISLVETDQD